MQLPTININGTDRGDLVKDHILAMQALRAAIEAVGAVSPHGRDYQTLPAGSYSVAAGEHAARMVALRTVLAEIETIAEHLA